jgi:hypothetical protein
VKKKAMMAVAVAVAVVMARMYIPWVVNLLLHVLCRPCLSHHLTSVGIPAARSILNLLLLLLRARVLLLIVLWLLLLLLLLLIILLMLLLLLLLLIILWLLLLLLLLLLIMLWLLLLNRSARLRGLQTCSSHGHQKLGSLANE